MPSRCRSVWLPSAVSLKHIPPVLLTGIALLMGRLLAVPPVLRDRRQWKISATTLALGVYGLFGYHFLRLIGVRLRMLHVVAALLGFGGAAIAILGARQGATSGGWSWSIALAAAMIIGAAVPRTREKSMRR